MFYHESCSPVSSPSVQYKVSLLQIGFAEFAVKRWRLLVFSVWMLVSVPLFVDSQVVAPQTAKDSVLKVESALVVVPALVRTEAGELVFTLTSDDFVLTDDGIPQQLKLEQDTGGEPLALVVVVEAGGAGAREFRQLGPLPKMLDSVVGNVQYQIAVVAFDSHPSLVQKFTADAGQAAEAIAALTPGCSRQRHMENCAAPGSVHDLSNADNGAAILDSLGYAVALLRNQPPKYRRAILLISETIDRGSSLELEDTVRELSDANTTIYSVGFSTGRSEAAHYASKELPGGYSSPNPAHGCMGKDTDPDSDATQHKAVQAFDCLTQLAPPLALAKMAAIEAIDGMRHNVPETVAHLTGVSISSSPMRRVWSAAWASFPIIFPIATCSAFSHNLRIQGFTPLTYVCASAQVSLLQLGAVIGQT
jgi:VWFA-related protein